MKKMTKKMIAENTTQTAKRKKVRGGYVGYNEYCAVLNNIHYYSSRECAYKNISTGEGLYIGTARDKAEFVNRIYTNEFSTGA